MGIRDGMEALSESDLRLLRPVFDLHDLDRKGRIELKAAHHLAILLGYDPHDKDAPRFEDAFTAINGVSWEQFIAWVSQLTLQPVNPRHKKDFRLLDGQRTGLITQDAMHSFFATSEEPRCQLPGFSRDLVEMYDTNDVGGLDYAHFARFLKDNKVAPNIRAGR